MNNKKELWMVAGYWLLFWVLPAVVLLYAPIDADASAFFGYFNSFALLSLVLPVGYVLWSKVAGAEKLKMLLFYVVVPLIVFTLVFASQLELGIGGF